ncbi:MAG: catechol 1,2-dioxygenase, partial [Acidobacteriota bacterium]
MKRRTFIKEGAAGIVGVGLFRRLAAGGPRLQVGAATTTDILGPFYRPGAPMRVNINPSGFSGEVLDVSGTVYRDDGRT